MPSGCWRQLYSTRIWVNSGTCLLHTSPAGMYDAVRITIGKAEGKNWWCVLYPPMCIPAAQPKQTLEDVLEDSSVELVEKNPKYEVRFAVVEWFESIKQMFS